jgi:signal transduction histidine kinase
LRAPLVVKLVGANLAVVAILLGGWLVSGHPMTAPVALAIVGVIAVHLALVLIALRPIRDLDDVASRVWRGDYQARVSKSVVADHEVLRVGSMFNILLDSLEADRARMRALANEVIAAGETERAAIAKELHDSTAQRLAALLLELSAAARDCKDPELAMRLRAARDAAQELTEEVRLLSQTLRPAVLDDLGLVPALQKLARDSTNGTGIDVDVGAPVTEAKLPPNIASALYRVAQEAVRNAVRHSSARRIRIVLKTDSRAARLEVYDDGIGFDPAVVERSETAMKGGLLSMRERVALVDGGLEIKSAPHGGTTIVATVPLAA